MSEKCYRNVHRMRRGHAKYGTGYEGRNSQAARTVQYLGTFRRSAELSESGESLAPSVSINVEPFSQGRTFGEG